MRGRIRNTTRDMSIVNTSIHCDCTSTCNGNDNDATHAPIQNKQTTTTPNDHCCGYHNPNNISPAVVTMKTTQMNTTTRKRRKRPLALALALAQQGHRHSRYHRKSLLPLSCFLLSLRVLSISISSSPLLFSFLSISCVLPVYAEAGQFSDGDGSDGGGSVESGLSSASVSLEEEVANVNKKAAKQRERRERERDKIRDRDRDGSSTGTGTGTGRDHKKDRDGGGSNFMYTTSNRNAHKKKNYKDFLTWCQATLGIQTLLTIQDFTYIDHLEEWKYEHNHHHTNQYNDLENINDNNTDQHLNDDQPRTVTVRGLAATRSIQSGETIISIPYHALITIHTTIDHDPVLSQIIGPAARQRYGWMTSHKTTNKVMGGSGSGSSSVDGTDATSYYEIALLIVALLYHASLGRLSPLWFYIETLVEAPVDSMPYLWTERVMGEEFGGEGQEEVKKLVRGVKRDIREMYDEVMGLLVEEHRDIFGPPRDGSINGDENSWMFSHERFAWAFAMVNSRHWHLPLQDLDEALMQLRQIREDPDPADEHFISSSADAMDMPANQPTDAYVSLHDEALKREDVEETIGVAPTSFPEGIGIVTKHSFMAPLADMLNFGPPCARGQYNTETKAFEVVATCPFQKGQEVTFWYSDDCDDVIISNYGFTHPMVPRCPTIDDWKYRSELWKDYAETLEKTLSEAYEDLYDTLQELNDCNCVNDEKRDEETEIVAVKAADDRMEEMRQGRKREYNNHQKSNHEVNNHGGIRRTKLRSLEEERDEIGL